MSFCPIQLALQYTMLISPRGLQFHRPPEIQVYNIETAGGLTLDANNLWRGGAIQIRGITKILQQARMDQMRKENQDKEIHDNEVHDKEIHDNEVHDKEVHDKEVHDKEVHDKEVHDKEVHDKEVQQIRIRSLLNRSIKCQPLR
ncbi:hypothetical protein GNI_034980 [Gregarina niphandrodes]|uniref:Uncharacterized protein n=1 Tax=Gregarina niphandrodes TaxID=110365 RepID=A0A023BAT1_GRENI|nr:hypothetical protein GNI_034980 [Gregarina niphandrodes]EZG78556.1 hypothetical protein GNI_034980 [Gregarina niphandrodes]|eukprot:XP_011129262.1 hypothetical protein GNI_034980 [Gregarina niphandrodes]